MTEFTGFKYEDLEIGQSHETVHEITADDIQLITTVNADQPGSTKYPPSPHILVMVMGGL